MCNPSGKNPGNVWEISTKAHYGNEHFAIFPEDLVARIVSFASQKGDWVLDPFMGRGTTGIVCALTGRNFTGIDLYPDSSYHPASFSRVQGKTLGSGHRYTENERSRT